jgi:hypothetical protein
MTDENVARHDLSKNAFPFTVYAYPAHSAEDVNPVWQQTITGPGVMKVPGIQETGQRVRIVVHYADGTVERQ